MSTRGVIGHLEVRGENVPGFTGTYEHFDSYPSWFGPQLWKLIQERGLPAVGALIDAHPAGWRHFGDECYCHDGGRDDQDMRMTEEEAEPLFMEWVYALHETGFLILKGAWKAKCFVVLCNVNLAEPEPDWLFVQQLVEGHQSPVADDWIDGPVDCHRVFDLPPPARLCVIERGATGDPSAVASGRSPDRLKPWRFGEPCTFDLLQAELLEVVAGLGGG